MEEGLAARKENEPNKRKVAPIKEYIQTKRLAKKMHVSETKLSDNATLVIDRDVAYYTLPTVKTRKCQLYNEIVKFALLHSLKNGKSSLTKEELELLARVIDEFA